MRFFRIERKKQFIFILLLFIGVIFSNLFIENANFPSANYVNNDYKKDNSDRILNIPYHIPQTADYTSLRFGNGNLINISLHEALLNTSQVIFPNLDTANTFFEASPIFNGFNSSYINITVEDIYAPNKSLTVEGDLTPTPPYVNQPIGGGGSNPNSIFASFTPRGVGYITNISIYARKIASLDGCRIKAYLYNSSLVSGKIRPNTNLGQLGSETEITLTSYSWINITNCAGIFNSSSLKTYNNYFFIRIQKTDLANLEWNGNFDFTIGDRQTTGALLTASGITIDLSLKLGLKPLSNSPKPEQIGLKINSTALIGDSILNNKGYWTPTKAYNSTTGNLRFQISADWWNVNCKISKAQLNYTKTDLKSSSDFKIIGSGQNVEWNVTRNGGLNYFESKFDNYTINFTVSSSWSGIKVYNGIIDKTSFISSSALSNGFTKVTVRNAGNGTFWFLNATSSNLLQAIDTNVGAIITSTVNYTNIVHFDANFTQNINSGLINLSVYSPVAISNQINYTSTNSSFSISKFISLGNWDLSNNVNQYGDFRVQMFWYNGTAASFIEKTLTILADTSLSLISPSNMNSYLNNVKFNLTVYSKDEGFNQGIKSINVNYTNIKVGDGSLSSNGTDGYYYMEINTTFYEFGWNDIKINASKQYFNNKTITFTFQKINQTAIEDITKSFNVIRGINITYAFNYTDINYNKIIVGASITEVYKHGDFTSFWKNYGNGTYAIYLNTSKVTVGLYDYNFSISDIGEEPQAIKLSIEITITQTRIENIISISEIVRSSHLNQTIKFYMNDTTNNNPVLGFKTVNVTVSNNVTGSPWNTDGKYWRLYDLWNNGTYILNVTLTGLNSGTYILKLNASGVPNYDWSIAYVSFYLRGNYSTINIKEVLDPSGELSLINNDHYQVFEGSNLDVEFNITDNEFLDSLVRDDLRLATYSVWYNKTSGTSQNGTLSNSLSFDANSGTYKGSIDLSTLDIGDYLINLSVSKINYEVQTRLINITIVDKSDVRITVVDQPKSVNAGSSFKLSIKIEIKQGSSWKPLKGATVKLIPYFNDKKASELSEETDKSGEIEFEITVPNSATILLLQIEVESGYNIKSEKLEISNIKIVPLLEVLLPYLIIIGVAAAVAISIGAVYKGVIVPKRREKERVLAEVKTIFDDAINLEHLLVLYKATGTCIFFKSFGTEGIDPELISGFLTAVSSFGKEMESQQSLNEITYGDKMLLLSDGEFVRVALVLSKKASIILSKRLKEFIDSFEKAYAKELPDWRGQLDIFKNADHLSDEILNTSIILPHEISVSTSDAKALKIPIAKEVLKVANSLIEGSERKFFFIATLLTEAAEKTGKESAEVFMGIKELRDKKILKAIEISKIEKQPISQQEMSLISQKVSEMPNLNPEERQRLISELAEMGSVEREAYIASLSEKHEIVTAPVKSGTSVIENAKKAKKEIANLIKNAKGALKEKDHQKAIEIYRNAAMIATNWDLSKEFESLEDTIRLTTIEGLQVKMKKLEDDAKVAVKEEKFADAAQNYKQASEAASEIFKLGVTEMTKEVKRLSNKAKEFEKLK